MPFPLPFVPHEDYHVSSHHARYFGAPRDHGKRIHAGCDLFAKLGTAIYAVDDGVVVDVSTSFYHGTGAIALRHTPGYVVRYCEVLTDSVENIKRGQRFHAGDTIAQVGKMFVNSMLHFELYAGTAMGPLTNRHSHSPYQRRADLMNPIAFLDKLRGFVGICHAPVFPNASGF